MTEFLGSFLSFSWKIFEIKSKNYFKTVCPVLAHLKYWYFEDLHEHSSKIKSSIWTTPKLEIFWISWFHWEWYWNIFPVCPEWSFCLRTSNVCQDPLQIFSSKSGAENHTDPFALISDYTSLCRFKFSHFFLQMHAQCTAWNRFSFFERTYDEVKPPFNPICCFV